MTVNLHNELQSLADVQPSRDLWADALARVGSGDRFRPPRRQLRRASLGAGLVLAATCAALTFTVLDQSSPPALTGVTIQVAGYHFKTPAGFKASSSGACHLLIGPRMSNLPPSPNAFTTAASADGGCIEVTGLILNPASQMLADAQPVDVGAYQGYLIHGELLQLLVATTYDGIDTLGGPDTQYLVLTTNNLTADQLVAIALSGLPGSS